MKGQVRTWIVIIVCSLVFSGCDNREVRQTMRGIEAILDERPAEALMALDEIDSTLLDYKPLRIRFDLLYTIALDKNHINDGRYVAEIERAANWYERYGDRRDKLRAMYYFGDQLRGAGRIEEAAVQFVRSEKEAVSQKDWFFAGMSARSLYYVFARTHNYPEELSCIERAVGYFRLAGKEVHEDDARIKLAMAYYDSSQMEKADSVFNQSIEVAVNKRDTLRLCKALVESVDVLLFEEPFLPDSVIARLAWAERLGYSLDSRSYANYAMAYSLIGKDLKSEGYLRSAYNLCRNNKERVFVATRELSICEISGKSNNVMDLLKYIDSYISQETSKTLEQSVVKSYNLFLELANDRLSHENKIRKTLLIMALFLTMSVVAVAYMGFKRITERHRLEDEKLRMEFERRRLEEENRRLETDRLRLACEELESFGFEAFDKVGRAYYSAENSPVSVVKAYGSMIEKLRNKGYEDLFIANIDKTHDGVVTRLESQIPKLSRTRLVFFAYLVQGLSYTTISVIMNCNQRQNLYDIRKRLVQTIKKNSPVDKDLFLSYLESHD